jgi:glucose-1-phosphate adenylyltransferase
MDNVLSILLAGGKGTRLEPLTRDRAKPAVPFGAVYRIIDLALSNCLNSRQMNVLVLTQYKSLSLQSHISRGWSRFFHPEFGQSLAIASPQQRVSEDWYLGTANAVYQNIYSIEKSGAAYVLILAADHVYKMDYRPMLEFHREHGGTVTVATLRCPATEAAGRFGVIESDQVSQVVAFREKPVFPAQLPGDEGYCLASMGIYVFTTTFLVEELRRNAEGIDSGHDFGQDFLPRVIGREPVRAFTFSGQGTGALGYWRDVGTVDSYFRANMDLLADVPALDLYDKTWPIYSFQPSSPPPRIMLVPEAATRRHPGPRRSLIANGTVADGSLCGAVLGFDCRIDRDASVEESILFDRAFVGCGAHIRRAILDEGVEVRPRARIGFDLEEERARGFVVTEAGITCVPADAVVES